MKRIIGSLKRPSRSSKLDSAPIYPENSPEGIVAREVDAFCRSGGGPGNDSSGGPDFARLPTIVENAECSPSAAKAAAVHIRKMLSSDTPLEQSYLQYNAIMLIRILVDNPGLTFTRNIDSRFVSAVKGLLRNGKDRYVRNFLCETLDSLEATRSWDENLADLLQTWKKERGRSPTGKTKEPSLSPYPVQSQTSTLPPPDELSSRILEAQSSAKLLLQFIQNTPSSEIQGNELIKEFSDRCRSASQSIQSYIESTNPAPDERTLVALIETNDELSVSLSKYSHAILDARKASGNNTDSSNGNASPSASASASASTSPVRAPILTSSPLPFASALASSSSPDPETGTSRLAQPALQQRQDIFQNRSPSRYPASRQQTPDFASSSSASPPAASVSVPNSTSSAYVSTGRYQYNSEDFQIQNPFADYHLGEGQKTNV
ncbi:hypothetical protein MAP00_002730 [Monascus purpureus]|nr:hypothetical protein MAP00_002730 [Monascus purpureus]